MRSILNKSVVTGLAMAAALTAVSTMAEAQVTSTVVLKSGERHSGLNLSYRIDRRQVSVRENQQSEPSFPVDQVAFVDFSGQPSVPGESLAGSDQAVVLRNGSVLRGELIELGHVDNGNVSTPFLVIINTAGGQRRLDSHEVARVYFANPASVVTVSGQSVGSSSSVSNAPIAAAPGHIGVAGAQAWTATGIQVRRNQTLTFTATGQVSVGGGLPAAAPGGTSNTNANNPVPNAATGALIGRIGNNKPFLVGAGSTTRASDNGELFLGINDSHHGDNDGAFDVEVLQNGQTTTGTGRATRR